MLAKKNIRKIIPFQNYGKMLRMFRILIILKRETKALT